MIELLRSAISFILVMHRPFDMVEDEIAKAIRLRRMIGFAYGRARRLLEPHLIGYAGTGSLVVLGWTAGEGPNWRTFPIAEIRDLSVLEARFAPRPGFSAGDPRIARVVAHV